MHKAPSGSTVLVHPRIIRVISPIFGLPGFLKRIKKGIVYCRTRPNRPNKIKRKKIGNCSVNFVKRCHSDTSYKVINSTLLLFTLFVNSKKKNNNVPEKVNWLRYDKRDGNDHNNNKTSTLTKTTTITTRARIITTLTKTGSPATSHWASVGVSGANYAPWTSSPQRKHEGKIPLIIQARLYGGWV